MPRPKAMGGQGYIRLRHALITHPKVLRIAMSLQATDSVDDVDEAGLSTDDLVTITLGALVRVWSWANRYATADGIIIGADAGAVDLIAKVERFAEALSIVGWIVIDSDKITFPEFEEFNVTRSQALSIDKLSRGENENENESENDNNNNARKSPKSITNDPEPDAPALSLIPDDIPPEGTPGNARARVKAIAAAAERIYQAYPRKRAKVQAIAKIGRIIQDGFDPAELLKRTEAWAATNPTNGLPAGHADNHCPYPSTWFHQRRFEDPEFDPDAIAAENASKARQRKQTARAAANLEQAIRERDDALKAHREGGGPFPDALVDKVERLKAANG